MPELNELKDELEYCLQHGQFGPRTGVALRWALDVVNEMTRSQESLALPDSEGGEI